MKQTKVKNEQDTNNENKLITDQINKKFASEKAELPPYTKEKTSGKKIQIIFSVILAVIVLVGVLIPFFNIF